MYVLPFVWVLGLVLGYAPFQRRTHFNSEAWHSANTARAHTHSYKAFSAQSGPKLRIEAVPGSTVAVVEV